jgi:hypothetical protein
MKRFLLSAITIIAAGTFISCNQNVDGLDNTNPNVKVEVNFATNITKVELPTTRMSGTTWDANDSIGIFMFEKASTTVVEDMNNIKYVTATGGLKGSFLPADETIFFPDNGDEVRFMSYYPYTSEISTFTYNVDVSDQTNQSAIDLLYSFADAAFYDKETPDKKVSLMFNHKLTKIIINIRPGEGLEDEDIINTVVTFEKFNTKADFNLITGALSNPTELKTITSKKMTTAANGYKVSFESIVLPVVDPSTTKIVFDLNNGDTGNGINSDLFTWNFNTDELQSGFEYIYNVTVKRSGIVVEAEIKEWEDGGDKEIIAE